MIILCEISIKMGKSKRFRYQHVAGAVVQWVRDAQSSVNRDIAYTETTPNLNFRQDAPFTMALRAHGYSLLRDLVFKRMCDLWTPYGARHVEQKFLFRDHDTFFPYDSQSP